jgi:hypothetical protein
MRARLARIRRRELAEWAEEQDRDDAAWGERVANMTSEERAAEDQREAHLKENGLPF